MSKVALITGITGQDGSYMAELLLEKEYKVYGMRRRSATSNMSNLEKVKDKVELLYGDLTDGSSISGVIQNVKPDELYHFACQSQVRHSFDIPCYTLETAIVGTAHILEAVKSNNLKTKIYNAASSEMFGDQIDEDGYQRETTLMNPQSPYAIGKKAAFDLCRLYRQSYGMFVSSGILYNHESPRRGLDFVTRKVTNYVAQLYYAFKKNQTAPVLKLGNLDAKRDWGHSRDFVEACWMMLQHGNPGDFVIATGESHSIRDLLDIAFKVIGISDWHPYVAFDASLLRPSEVPVLKGDASKASRTFMWKPQITFEELIIDMVKHDMWYHEKN